jgi:Uma2 family endonuclease
MGTATVPPLTVVQNGVRMLTAADVAVLPRTLPSGDVRYELHDGRLIVMPPPGDIHARRQARFIAYLFTLGEQRGYGEARGEVGLLLRRNPDHLVGPDAVFIARASLPPRLSPEGYLLTIPELVVEVRSKNDTQPEVDEKVRDYQAAGVVLVWIADPDAWTVTAYRPGQPPSVFAVGDTLTADPVIPGFAVPVADLLPA